MKRISKYKVDIGILVPIIVFFLVSVVSIYSTRRLLGSEFQNLYIKQIIWYTIGLIFAYLVMFFGNRWLYNNAYIFYLVGVVSLVLVLFFGVTVKNATCWFRIPFLGTIQPSEFIKVIVIIWLSCFYDKHQKQLNKYSTSLFPICVCAGIAFLIFLQPDLGTMIIFVCIVAAIFFAVPISKEIKVKTTFAALGFMLFAFVAFASSGKTLLQERQQERLKFTNPCADLLDSGNQVCNSYIAINKGGLTGAGLGNSTQKYLYLPEPYTDFIYAVVVEELGLVAGVLLLIGYMIVLYRILIIGRNSPSNKGSAICYGVAIYIFLHVAVNLMGILGLMPMTGVPLPFISYGGSFTICLIAALTAVQRVSVETALAKERSVKRA